MSADLDALAALERAATPGPWRDMPMGSEGSVVIAGGNTITTARKPATCREFADAEFIAAARNAQSDLLTELAAAREALGRVRELAEVWVALDGETVSCCGLMALTSTNRNGADLTAALAGPIGESA